MMQNNMTSTEYNKRYTGIRNKYGNKKTTVDGYTFDSKAEARYYEKLKLLKKAGEIKDFKLQPKYLLQDKFTAFDGSKQRVITYVADFEIKHNDGSIEVVDVKGHKTDVYKLKKKLFMCKYKDYVFREVGIGEI